MSTEREAAEQRFREIHNACKGKWFKSLLAMPRALAACRDIFVAAVREEMQRREK